MDYDQYMKDLQKKLDAAMPWVGLYIVAASTVCTLAMAADAFNGFRRRKLWFPCKFFSLNAASLTLLAVALKLPVDLNTNLIVSDTDQSAKYMGLIFMSTALANFMPSLGSMNHKEILANVVALCILVITVIGNVSIQLIELGMSYLGGAIIVANTVPMILMLFLLTTTVSLAIAVPNTKRRLELMYQEKHIAALSGEEVLTRRQALRIDDQRGYMMKYLVMAETSSPQFVMARSVYSSWAATCLFATIILAGIYILTGYITKEFRGESPYGFYTTWILYVQAIGVVVGTIAPAFRWFVAVSFRCSTTNRNGFKNVFKIEAYWTESLVNWRDSFSPLQIQHRKCRKYLHDIKWFTLTFCIAVQVLVVIVSKLLLYFSALLMSPFFKFLSPIRKFVRQSRHVSGNNIDMSLSNYVLLLEGEVQLPGKVVKNICREADRLILKGRKMQPQSLFDLLHKFVNFNGVGQFDNDKIPSLHSQEIPNCWTLPVVTLTSIAIALPNFEKHKGKLLLKSVSEGLSLTNIVEKTLVKNELVNIRKAADICWVGVVLYMKWLDIDLSRMSIKCKNKKEVLEYLSNKAQEIIVEFKNEEESNITENPLNWPAKVVAANSMYRISRTILLSYEEESQQTDDGLFERLSIMIADILAACLTNLPHVITTMCHSAAIEKREKSVREAFLLLGKVEQIVELVQQQEWPTMDHDKAASVEEWRTLFWQNNGLSSVLDN